MKKNYFLLLFFLLFSYLAFSQAIAGPDKTISGGKGTKIGIASSSKLCYHWEASPGDPAFKDINIAEPLVSPAKTTVYKLTATGTDFSSINMDEVTVFKFDIEYFRYNAAKPWKVVVGEPIEFNAIASSDCKDWDWDMEDGFPDVWNPIGGNSKSGNSIKIPESDMPSNNNSFGDTYGTLNVSCKDQDDNTHEISSTELNPPIKVNVFYMKDATNNPGGSTPNWFYYWRQFIPTGRIGSLVYNGSLSGYASTNPRTRITQVSNKASELNDETGHNGLHTFYETVAHESHHIVLWEGWWGVGGSPDSIDDTDNDEYPDSWESTGPDAIRYGFMVGVDDGYSSGGVGYTYEEDKCRAVELALSETAYDSFDWSFDPTGSNQGKQW